MADVLDILQIKTPHTPRISTALGRATPATPTTSTKKKNKDLPRELRALAETNKFITITPIASSKSQFKEKRQFREPVKHYVYNSFHAIERGPVLHHWERQEDVQKEYAFKELNKKIRIFKYTTQEYTNLLQATDWTREQTDELFATCEMFDLRWPVIHDRITSGKSMEQCKQRYYSVARLLLNARANTKEKKELAKKHPILQQPYDFEEDVKRRQQLDVLYKRGMVIDQREQWLKEQVRKIDAIKKKRAEETKAAQQKEQRKQVAEARKKKREKVLQQQQHEEQNVQKPTAEVAALVVPEVPVPSIEESNDPFLLNLCINTHVKPGIKLRSQLMKPAHNKLSKRVDLILNERKLFTIPDVLMGTKEIHEAYNELRTKIGVYLEIQKLCLKKEVELQRAIGSRDALREQLGAPATIRTPPMLPPPHTEQQAMPEATAPVVETVAILEQGNDVITNEDDEKTYQKRGKKRTNSASGKELEPTAKRHKK